VITSKPRLHTARQPIKVRSEAHFSMRRAGLFSFMRSLGHPTKKDVTEVTKARKERRARPRQQHRQRVELPQAQPHQILLFREWCQLNGISQRTGRRILAGEYGPPPVITQLSPRRIGVSYGANLAWQQSRERA
jgi:hypothetical protein